MRNDSRGRIGLPWPELLVGALVIVALISRMIPSLSGWLVSVLDVRNWSRNTWIGLNISAIVILVGIRFRVELKSGLRFLSINHNANSRSKYDTCDNEFDADYEIRTERDAEWRERAKRRLPFM